MTSIDSKRKKPRHTGLGQLSLVEHALCPLDENASLIDNLRFQSEFTFTDKNRHTAIGRGRISATYGLSKIDEFYLWGLLGLTFSQPEPSIDFRATPHYILRRLGRIDTSTRRGGSAYSQFRDSLRRLAHVTYDCDKFYDPIRGEHRKTSFGFLSYSLPLDEASSRAYRIVWDPLFFELCGATGGRLFFDMDLYRSLDPSSRRLFLFLSKIFWRRSKTAWLNVRHVCTNVLGVSRSVDIRDLTAKKLKRPMERLEAQGIVAFSTDARSCIRKKRKGVYEVQFTRGPYYQHRRNPKSLSTDELPIAEILKEIGLDSKATLSVIRHYKPGLLQEWADITFAAKERYGAKFFRKSMAAYFMDNIKNAAAGKRGVPDWWHEYRKEELRRTQTMFWKENAPNAADFEAKREKAFQEYLMGEARDAFSDLMKKTFVDFSECGQPEAEAKKNAQSAVLDHLEKTFVATYPQWQLSA